MTVYRGAERLVTAEVQDYFSLIERDFPGEFAAIDDYAAQLTANGTVAFNETSLHHTVGVPLGEHTVRFLTKRWTSSLYRLTMRHASLRR
ncbi:MAG TPA: hypothetical protein VD735_05985 [Candidatus Saccharimonadales bacterium]|nr:hypothetical protein [Candidatus Saccharimonadales bacterium]